jgi:hypothetical protein
MTEPTIVAVTSLRIDHGIIAPVTPATYVSAKIALPLTHVAYPSASAASTDVHNFVKTWPYKKRKSRFPTSECRRTRNEPWLVSHHKYATAGKPVSKATQYWMARSTPKAH